MAHVLLLEDDPDIREGIAQHFERDGIRLVACGTGKEALGALTAPEGHHLDAAILDLTLPDMDGLDVLRIIRHHPNLKTLPVVVVTARTELVDRLLGLELGADDYVSKPFSMRELGVRVRGVLRRARFAEEIGVEGHQLLVHGEIRVDLDARAVWVEDRLVDLTRREFELLTYFLQNPGRALSRERLLREVWGQERGGETRTVDAHVRRLRIKLKCEEIFIETLIGVGYKLRVEGS